MTGFEWLRARADRVLPVLHGQVRRDLATLVRDSQLECPRILDAGGRRSPYTVGLSAAITILEVPGYGVDQDLGVTRATLAHLQRRRSNVEEVVLEDMTDCSLPSESFDGVVCVEVIEHVREDDRFVQQVSRVLRPGGWAYFTTPNGDYIRNEPPNFNPDHVRHYRLEELRELLSSWFGNVDVRYGVKTGRN
ncbi:MAG: methyltransferase domain-containing protein, partial [Thermoanaerobaculia bacterium]